MRGKNGEYGMRGSGCGMPFFQIFSRNMTELSQTTLLSHDSSTQSGIQELVWQSATFKITKQIAKLNNK